VRLCQKRREGPVSCAAYQEVKREKLARQNTKTEWKNEDMKTVNEITRIVQGSGLALAAILIATFTAVLPANAQFRPTGDDGIAASPRLRAQLDERRVRATPVSATAASMACPKCKDAWVAKADITSRGLGARSLTGQTTNRVAQHLCAGCGTDWATTGTGRAKLAVASHKCSGCGSESLACCPTKGTGAVATKGMDKKIEIAPLK
jgi:hypothetical protein